ncbi:MAG: CHAD domain-containing protein [Victivallales bacterium]
MNREAETIDPEPAKSPRLAGDMSCREAALRSFDFYFRNFLWNEKGARIGKDPEFLHYLRVASKRLRVALTVFEKYFPEDDIPRYKMELKSLAQIFGKARDTDVYLEFLNNKAAKTMHLKELEVFNKYRNFFLRRKKFRQKAVLKKLDSEDYKRFVEGFTNFISRSSASEDGMPVSTVTEISDREIRTKVEELMEHSGKLNRKASDSKLHKFRIKCRKLRYKVEIFLNIAGSNWEKLDRMLIELQHSLGSHHDAVTAGEKLNSYIRTHKEHSKSRALKKLRELQEKQALKFRKCFFIQLRSRAEITFTFGGP